MAAPNPFQQKTIIRYSTDNTSMVSARIYDISGTLVRDLFDGTVEAGSHTISWRGGNTRGERLPAGIYFVEVKTADHCASQKLLLTR